MVPSVCTVIAGAGLAGDGAFEKNLAAHKAGDGGGIRRRADHRRQPRPVVELPDIIARIGEQTTQYPLLAERAAGDGREIAIGGDGEVAAENMR